LLPLAKDDLQQIVDYVAAENTEAAAYVLDRFEDAFNKLKRFPLLGRIPKDEEIRKLGYRYLIVDDYLFFYTVGKSGIVVHRVVHGARRYKEFL